MDRHSINDRRRASFRNIIRKGMGWGGFAIAGLLLASPAQAQLRTGRDSDREFYSDSVPSEPKVSVSPAKTKTAPNKTGTATRANTGSGKVITNTSNSPNTGNGTVKKIKTVKSDVVQASASEPVVTSSRAPVGSSRVVQAGCKNCQAGVSHSHAPIASPPVEEEMVQTGLSPDMYDPGTFSLEGSSCQSCDPCGTSYNPNVIPLGILGHILSRSRFRIEAATFWPHGQNLPQLVTTRRPANDPATDGLIGQADTINLFGGGNVLGGGTQGLRGEVLVDLDAARTHGLMFRFFDAGSQSLSFNSTPSSEPVVTRPFFSTSNNAQSTIAINYPGSTSGSLNANISTEVYGGDILVRKLWMRDCAGRLEWLAGYQTARLADDLRIDSTTTALTNIPAPAGTVSQLSDHFSTTNRFNGFALGITGVTRHQQWSLSGMFKLGMGNMERSVAINGSSTITVPGNPATVSTTSNGLLARSTNDGNYVMNTFVVSPELNLTIGYRLSRNLEATVGYNFLELPKVARVGDQLDRQLASNLSNPPVGDTRPSFALLESSYVVQSLNYGLQWRY